MKWTELIKPEVIDKMAELGKRLQAERESGKIICPDKKQIYRALTLTPPENVKAVIIGQDPYHSPGQANGLAFSISPGHPLQPSLRNIFKEYQGDLQYDYPITGDLTPWAERGVLLLNTSLTIEAHRPNSHLSWGWPIVTSDIIRICSELPQPIVFLAWGRNAHELVDIYISPYEQEKIMKEKKKAVFKTSHPGPLTANRSSGSVPAFIGSKPFSHTNQLLQDMGGEPINWKLP